MINYLVTKDAIIIQNNLELIQISKEDSKYKEILKVVGNKSSTFYDLDKFNQILKYEDDDISIINEKNTSKIEVYYNGKYYDLNEKLSTTILSLLKRNENYTTDHCISFIKKLISNPYFNLDILINKLYEKGFCFTFDGDIIVSKDYEEEDNYYYHKRRDIVTDKVRLTLVTTNPSNINDNFEIRGYTVLGHVINTELLNGGCVGNTQKLLNIHDQIAIEYSKESQQKYEKQFNVKFTESYKNRIQFIQSLSRKLLNTNV